MTTQYSIIIPTHNRHNLMLKNIEYFTKFQNCNIYICDSSKEHYPYKFPENITYLHMPNKFFVGKMLTALSHIKTEFVVSCADDDFILEDSIIQLIHVLKAKKYVMGVGKYYSFATPFCEFKPLYSCNKMPNVKSKQSTNRVKSYMKNYYMCLWSVYDTKILLESYEILNKSSYYNDNFIELVIAINMAVNGKILFSNRIWGIREVLTEQLSWGAREKNLFEYANDDYNNFYSDVRNINKHFNDNSFLDGINYYLNSFEKNLFSKIMRKSRCMFNSYIFKNKFHDDFIKKLICRHYKDNKC